MSLFSVINKNIANSYETYAESISNSKLMNALCLLMENAKHHNVVEKIFDSLTGNIAGFIAENMHLKSRIMFQINKSEIMCILDPGYDNVLLSFGENNLKIYDYYEPIHKSISSSPAVSVFNFKKKPCRKIELIEYYDCILIVTKLKEDHEYWYQCAMVGKLYYSTISSDYFNGANGFGILGGKPMLSTAYKGHEHESHFWITENSNSSLIKISNFSWIRPQLLIQPHPDQAKDIDERIRLSDIPIRAGKYGPLLGNLKYIKQFKRSGGHGLIINSKDENNNESKQTWMRFRYGQNDNHLCTLWSTDTKQI